MYLVRQDDPNPGVHTMRGVEFADVVPWEEIIDGTQAQEL